MATHDPLKFAIGLSARLAARSRHVCLLLGAGASRAGGLPDVSQLQERVLEALSPDQAGAFSQQLTNRNLEQALSRVRRMTALLEGEQVLDGLTKATAETLDRAVCRAIVGELDTKNADLTPAKSLAAWVARADYQLPLEIFTVNYDLLLETALDQLRVPYFDGFLGTLRARFHTELVDGSPDARGERVPSFFARLWKLHGSVNWAWEGDHQIVRLGQPVPDGNAAAIYPCDTKYEESRRVPFVVLHDRLRRAIQLPETLVLISGYSFSDDHLNEMLFDAATRRERSEFVVFCHGEIPAVLIEKAATTPNLQVIGGQLAVLGGTTAEWKGPEDAPLELWSEDKLALCDFRQLAAYLARGTSREAYDDLALREAEQRTPRSSQDTNSHG